MSWLECRLGDIIELKYGKGLPERKRVPGNVPVYGSGGIVGMHKEALVAGPGIILGRKGSVGSVYYEKNDFFPIDTVYYVLNDSENSDFRFLYYLLLYLPLETLNSDAAVPGLNRETALRQKISIPDLPIQRKTASILSAYDDLIENNQRRIALLEHAARLLYKEWFVHLRFPGHEHVKIIDGVPGGWEKTNLGTALTLQRGFDLPVEARKAGSIPIYASTGVHGYHDVAKVEGPGVVTGRSGSLGTVIYVTDSFWPLNTTLWVKEFKRVSPIFAYHLLLGLKLEQYDGGAAVPTLNRNDVHRIDVLIPSYRVINLFSETVTPFYQQISKFKKYSDKLKEARDLILPRLMNGEIVV